MKRKHEYRKPGRPRLSPTGERGKRYQVYLPPSIADKIRDHGDGSLSQGINRLATKIRAKRRDRGATVNADGHVVNLDAK